MSDLTANLALPYLAAAQAQKHVTHNEALRLLDAIVQLSVLSRTLSAPPDSPSDGDRYIVATEASGGWSGKTGLVAAFLDGAWEFLEPRPGWLAWIEAEDKLLVYAGDSVGWNDFAAAFLTAARLAAGVPLAGVNTAADDTNRLAVKSDAVLLSHDDVTPGSGDMQMKFNKKQASSTASILFQDNWSGRAEIGLCGDDALHIKVSGDGSTWHNGFPSAFEKTTPTQVCFSLATTQTVVLNQNIWASVLGILRIFASGTAVSMPTLTAGTDYAIYACNDGSLIASSNFSAPDGYTTSNSRRIGGFHYAPGSCAAAQAGGDTTPQINPYSLWDLKWRPACPDPRGMALVAGRFWCDIYLCGTDVDANGTSKNGVSIGDGSTPPKVPSMFGGNGSTTYGSFTWFEAGELMKSVGKDLLDYAEFSAAAFGVTEAVSRGNDAGTTGLSTTNSGSSNLDQKFTSKWGVIQAAGVMWIWGRDLSYRADGADAATITAFSWKDSTESRGQIYSQSSYGLVAARFGASWSVGSNAGSRASGWNYYPWNSVNIIGARGRSDHLCHD